TAASEILTSFAAQYDFGLAGRQCVALSVVVLLLAAPLAYVAAPQFASQILARQTRGFRRFHQGPIAALLLGFLALLALVMSVAPVVGLLLPLVVTGTEFGRAWGAVERTAFNTVLYAVGAGMTAVILGLGLAFCVGRSRLLRTFSLGGCRARFAMPPGLSALGIVQMETAAPASTDPLLRSRLTVCLALGMRYFPVAAVLGMHAWGSMSPTWAQAAAIHGVPLQTYLRK